MDILTKICNNIKIKEKEFFENFLVDNYKLNQRNQPINVIERIANSDFFVIAEVKKASPSKGIIREDFNHIEIAKEYLSIPVDAISVLTEEDFFLGKKQYLEDIRKLTDSTPLLRKDFIIHEAQIYEAYNLGADLILLIAAVLTKEELEKFINIANQLKLTPLVEVHNKEELYKVLEFEPKLIGINNRDLKTFNVDLNTTLELKKLIPKDIFVISESGIKTNDDIKLLKINNINGVLIGETFMREKNIKDAFLKLFK